MNTKQRLIGLLMPLVQIYWRIRKPKTFGVKVLITHPQDEEKVLLVLHSYGSRTLWNIPGGGYNPKKETAETAARREVMEELNVSVLNLQRIGEYETAGEGKQDTVTVFSGTFEQADGYRITDEIEEVTWENYKTALRRQDDVARVARRAIKYKFDS